MSAEHTTDTTDTDTASLVTLLAREARGETIGEAVVPAPPCGPLFRPADAVALLALVGVALGEDAGPNGRDILDAAHRVGWPMSPGTAYPALHDLLDEGLVTRRQYVRTKRYTIDDREAARERLAHYECRLQWLADAARVARTELE